jgi:hypothetical protein
MPWLVARLRRETPSADDGQRALYDAAVAAATRYPMTAAGQRDEEASWDELLACIDEILVIRQRRHLDAVRDAGVSGGDVPPPGAPT